MARELFLSNDSEVKFIERLRFCFKECKSFMLTVSFIKEAGLILIKNDIEEALKRGIKGKIITSTYQNFTDISSLETFRSWADTYPNFECRLDYECFQDRGYHSKGYLFEMDDHYEFLVGSTNITRYALLKNIEWNVSLRLNFDSPVLMETISEFDYLWAKTILLDEEAINLYKKDLEYAIERWDMDVIISQEKKLTANAMQRSALKELRRYRDMGVTKALVVASTGSGKTYLAAFDAKKFDARRLLFVVHRDTILVDAMNTFKSVFKSSRTYGFLTGKEKNLGADFIFATNITLSENLELFQKDEFDYIILDECHHAAASTYQKIMNYFNPSFLLGLTATPERMDNEDVFAMFDKNVPYELRLRDAIKNDLVVPFHYYGIRDEMVDYSDKAKTSFLLKAYSDEHVEFIAKQIELHRPKSTKLKAIAFCRDIEHATMMANKMAELGYGVQRLTGRNDTGERLTAYRRLQDENSDLEIIFTVDILNEGIDIPAINMVLFLRPTQSQTIFIQQLGRGLRKYENKEFLTVLDFIGNSYDRSVQVAFALGGLTSSTYLEKPLLYSLVRDNFKSLDLPNVEIHFDEFSQEEVLRYIEKTNFNTAKILKQDYFNFKKFLQCENKCPTHLDFLNADCAPDLMRLMKSKSGGKKNKCYYNFLKSVGEENIPLFNSEQILILETLSEMLPLIRKEEYLICQDILNGQVDDESIKQLCQVSKRISQSTLKTAIDNLLKQKVILFIDNKFEINCIIDEDFKEHLQQLLQYGIERFDLEFGEFEGDFKLYRNYQKQQIMLEIDGKPTNYMAGTKYDLDTNTTYVFVGLKKDTYKKENLQYKDKFLSPKVFQWESVNNTTLFNAEGKKLLNTKKVHVFVRKMDEEDGITLPFTYFGTGKFNKYPKIETNEGKPTLLFKITLDHEVPEEYRYDFLVPDEEIPEA